MEQTLILETAQMSFGKFNRILSPLSGAEILWRRGGGRDLVAICSGGDQVDAVLVGL